MTIALAPQRSIVHSFEVADTPHLLALLGAEGGIVVAGTPEAFTAVIRAETAKWLRVAKDAGLKPE